MTRAKSAGRVPRPRPALVKQRVPSALRRRFLLVRDPVPPPAGTPPRRRAAGAPVPGAAGPAGPAGAGAGGPGPGGPGAAPAPAGPGRRDGRAGGRPVLLHFAANARHNRSKKSGRRRAALRGLRPLMNPAYVRRVARLGLRPGGGGRAGRALLAARAGEIEGALRRLRERGRAR